MRNLKRALSLTLASVMLLGMMVVGSSAAAGYDDVSETDNVEAIEVLQAIEVMVGDERGFGPERPVNRAEMAVVMGKLLSLDYNYYTATCPFNDVYDWARGWVGACAANGIVSGRGEGVYDPGATVTAVEAASMLMRALGYFKYQNDYADGFEVSTVRQGTKIGIFDQVGSSATEPMTRNQVAQMVLNALQSAVVEPDGNTINLTTPDGTVYTGKVNYVSVTSAKPFATAISRTQATSVGSQNDGWIVELGERLYDGKLKLTDTTDAFGRPSRYWEYDAKEIGTYVKEELIRETYTVKVTGRTLHDLLGSTILKDYDLDVYIDGEDDPSINNKLFDARHLVRTNDVGVGGTGKGVLTQVFVDPDEGNNGLITIAIINTYLAIADEDFDDRTDSLDVTVYGINEFVKDHYIKNANNTDGHSNANTTGDSQKEGFILETEDFPSIVDAKDGDAYLVNVAQGEVQTIAKPEIMAESQITSFKKGDWIVSGGTQYDFASAAEFECETLYAWTQDDNSVVNLKETTYNIYLDKYGYAVGVEEVERVNNYVFITGVDTNTNNRFATQADASGIFMDGTMESMKIDLQAARELNDDSRTYNALTKVNSVKGSSLINKWFTYTVGDDGIYTVSLVRDSDAIDNDRARAAQFRTLTKDDAPSVIDTYQVPAGEVSGLGDTHGVNTVEGPKSIALRGNASANNKWYSVYGDDQSVYIVAELKTINHSKSNEIVNVIGGVDSVTVGIDNTNIEVWNRAKAMTADLGAVDDTAYGTYTLFDKDGDVIAAVVVGEDAGTVTNLVYTHKGINSETDNNAAGSDTRANGVKGTYTWTRYVIAEGEETLLTEVGSGLSKLKSMQPNTWYVVKYKANGEVKNVYPAWATENYNFKGLIDSDAKNELDNAKRLEDRYVNDIEELNRATNENGLVLYEVGQYNRTSNTDLRVGNIPMLTTKPSVDNHTFYVTTDTNAGVHRGFRVADDVKTVFIQTNNNDTKTTYETTYSGLEKVVGRLHDKDETNRGNWANPDTYHYEVSAVMKNGKASVVVIRDLNGAGAVIDGISRNYNLKLYGNLFTSSTTVTGASNAVVVVNGKEVASTGIGVDPWGNYTTYSIPQGATVGITDYDIDNTDPAFTWMSNMPYSEDANGVVLYNPYKLNVRYLNRSITFTMPAYETWIDGGRMNKDGTSPFRDNITGEKANKESSLEKVDITFNNQGEGLSLGTKKYGDPVEIVISNKAAKSRAAEIPALKAGDKYIVTVGSAQDKFNVTVNASNEIVFTYYLTGADIRAGKVVVYSIVADSTNVPASEYQVTIPAGVTVTDKDGKAIASGKVAKDTVIVVKASTDKTKVVKVNGVAIDKDTEFTVTGPITITLEEVKEDEVVLTVNVDATKGTATLAKTTVKKGESTTLTVEPKKADSTVAVTTTSGLTATKGANDRTWTIAVASTGTIATPATVTVTITEKGEEPPIGDSEVPPANVTDTKTVEVFYYGSVPTASDIKAKVEAAGIELVGDVAFNLDKTAAQAKNTIDEVVNITLTKVFKVTLDGTKELGYVKSTGATAGSALNIGAGNNAVNLNASTLAARVQSVANASGVVTISGTVKGDIDLTTAYRVWHDSSANTLTSVKYRNELSTNADKMEVLAAESDATANTGYFPAGTVLKVTGTVASDPDEVYVQLKAGDNLKGTAIEGDKTVDDDGNTTAAEYSYTVSLDDADNGVIELKEVQLYNVTVDGKSLGKLESTEKIPVAGGKVGDKYIVVSKTANGKPCYVVAAATTTSIDTLAADSGDNNKIKTSVVASALDIYDRGINLVKASQLTVSANELTKIVATMTDGESVKDFTTLTAANPLVAVGAKVEMTGKAPDGDENKYIAVDGKIPAISAMGTKTTSATATIPSMPAAGAAVTKVTSVKTVTIDLGANFDTAPTINAGLFTTATTGLNALNTGALMAGGGLKNTAQANWTSFKVDGVDTTAPASKDTVTITLKVEATDATYTLKDLNADGSGVTVKRTSSAADKAVVKSVTRTANDSVALITFEVTIP